MNALLISNCGAILTLRGPQRPRAGPEMAELGVVRRGAVLIRNGRIVTVGPEAIVVRQLHGARLRRVDAKGRVVLPGFVDSHTHALFAASRVEEYEARLRGATYQALARTGGGIQASAAALGRASAPRLAARLRAVLAQCLRHGTTTIEIKSGYGLEFDRELKMLRIIKALAMKGPLDIVPTLLAHDLPRRAKRRRSAFVQAWVTRLMPRVAHRRLAECVDVFCDRGYFTLAEAKRILTAGAALGFRLKVHADQLTRSGAAVMAAGLGAVSVDHLDRITPAEARRLRGGRTVATLLPGSVFHLGSGPYPPARALIDAGVPVALATNFNPGSSPTLNMQMILSLACSQMRMSPAEAVTAATINGAYALGHGGRIGSLEPGKQADLIILDVDDYREVPYYFGINHCQMVIKKGRIVFP